MSCHNAKEMKRQIYSVIFFVLAVLGLVLFSTTYFQAREQEQQLRSDLERRSILLSESLRESVQPLIFTANPDLLESNKDQLKRIVDKFAGRERLMGLIVYDNKDNILAISTGIPTYLPQFRTIATTAMDEDKTTSEFVRDKDERLYALVVPIDNDGSVIGSLMFIHNATYIDAALQKMWVDAVVRFFIYALIVSAALLLTIEWVVSKPLIKMMETIRALRTGDIMTEPQLSANHYFQPLFEEVTSIHRSLLEAQGAASHEARLRLDKIDASWTSQRLQEFTKDILKDRKLVVVSNREPYIHKKTGNTIAVMQPASGVTNALDPLMRACGGLWVAHGSGTGDKDVVDVHDRVAVPPSDPKYTLRRVWLTPEEEKGYYYGFSNDGLWPLCHSAFVEPIFREEDWKQYEKVNRKFAKSIVEEVKSIKRPIIFIQDYHFTLLPQYIKEQKPDAIIALFWHIPWPTSESFRICPWRKEILVGMLGADLLSFHTQLHCNNFMDTVRKELEARIDLEQFSVQKSGHLSYIKPFPIGIPFPDENHQSHEPIPTKDRDAFLKSLGVPPTEFIGVGVDRMDYTKGIIERFRAIEQFLDKNPEYKGKFTFIQASPMTRSIIPSYQHFAKELHATLERINAKFKDKNWIPIVFINKHLDRNTIDLIYKSGNICMVTSLHDGMNLVAKEFIAQRGDNQGVLILSRFTGASRELREALMVNPFDIQEMVDAIKLGLEMGPAAQKKRMIKLRETVKGNNIYRWAAQLLKTMVQLD